MEHGVCNYDRDFDDVVDDGLFISVEDGNYGVEDGVDGADKHTTHLSQEADCHLTQKSKQKKHVVGNKDNDVDDGVDNAVDDGCDGGDDNIDDDDVKDGIEDGDDNSDLGGDDASVDDAEKHLKHLSKGADDNDVDDDVDCGVDNSFEVHDDGGVEDGSNGVYKHLTYLSQGVDCQFTQRSKQKEYVVGNKDDDLDDEVGKRVEDGVNDSFEDVVDGDDMQLTHLS
eukprot:8054988-Ditylum_brightwellii.AAC.1